MTLAITHAHDPRPGKARVSHHAFISSHKSPEQGLTVPSLNSIILLLLSAENLQELKSCEAENGCRAVF